MFKLLFTLLAALLATTVPIVLGAPATGGNSILFPDSFTAALDGLFRSSDRGDGSNGRTVGEVVRSDDRLQRLNELIEKKAGRGFADDLDREDKHVTLFAPNNDAVKDFESHSPTIHNHHHHHHLFSHKRRPGRGYPGDGDRDEHDLDATLRYHVTHEAIDSKEDLFDGQLVETTLRLDTLGDQRQFVRVFKVRGQDVYLNMQARIVDEVKADNGVVYIVDRVLHTPLSIKNTLTIVPTEFSTTLVAALRANLLDDLQREKGLTLLAPDNDAWKKLGYKKLFYLFSESGRKDLEKIVRYHVSNQLWYSPEIVHDTRVKLQTLNDKEDIEIEAQSRHRDDDDDNRDDDDEDEDRDNAKSWFKLFDRNRDDGRDDRRKDVDFSDPKNAPNRWEFRVNKGEAVVRFTDGIARNGNILVLDRVLIPKNVDLPGDGRDDEE